MKYYPAMATGLSFSGGLGSTGILAMVLDEIIPKPKNFFVCAANPGMESMLTYKIVAKYRVECAKRGIPFINVSRNLYQGILDLKASGRTRFDMPPFWTRNRKTGKKGRLMQKCTREFKIAPMDRAIRAWMETALGISSRSKNIGAGTLVKWIGFTNTEWHRIKEVQQKYITLEYPLIERRMGNAELKAYFIKAGREIPPRSVCNGCFANDVEYFRVMYYDRPEDWAQAVAVDEAIRDLTQIGVEDECFVSSTLVPLRTMAAMGFENLQDQELIACHSGHCFV